MNLKKLTAIIATVALMTALTACGGDKVTITGMDLPDRLEVITGTDLEIKATFFADKDDASAEDIEKAIGKLEVKATSADESIVSVSEDGIVRGVKEGETEVTFTSKDGKITDTTTILVVPAVEDFFVDDITLEFGGDATGIPVRVMPENASKYKLGIKFKDGRIATLDPSGRILGTALGETEIEVSINDIVKTAKVTVILPETEAKP